MSKITEYEVASAFDAEDVLIKDGENGTMIISVEDAASEFKRLGGIDDDISGINQSVTQAMDTIASNIAGVETDYIASKDYAIGDLFIVNNVLYKATAAIAEEDVIDTEINCAVVNLGDEIGDIRSELANKANVDGSYSTLTAGNAEQLVGTVFTEDNAAYTFRTSGGSADIGDREYDEIVGGSIVWNQLFTFGAAQYTDKGLAAEASEDRSTITINGTTTNYGGAFGTRVTNVKGHVYYMHGHLSDYTNLHFSSQSWGDDTGNGKIIKSTSENEKWFYVVYVKQPVGTVIENVTARPQVIDLTQMFGSEIADYIYNLELTTPGAGVAWFRKYFPKDYYEYNAGELMHVSDLQSHDMVGFNLFDKDKISSGYLNTETGVVDSNSDYYTTDYIPVLKGNTVRIPQTYSTRRWFYDVNKNPKMFLNNSNTQLFTPPENGYIRVSVNAPNISAENFCINLSWDGERDGEYEPYVKHSYPLDSSLTLRGIPKLSTDGKLYYDGDHYKSDGTVERRYGIVDLGTLGWSYSPSSTTPRFNAAVPGCKSASGWHAINATLSASKYTKGDNVGQSADNYNKWGIYNATLFITDSDYTDAASFKEAMSGVYLVYELAEPTTEEAQPFQSPQIVDDFGTEEYVTSSIVPVGHITQYDSNLRAKLEMAPNSPDGDGDYLVRQTGGQNEYVPYTDGGRITALEGKIPAAPSANGSYILKCTVTDGTATYAWVAE